MNFEDKIKELQIELAEANQSLAIADASYALTQQEYNYIINYIISCI